jgi:carbon storage regulator
MLILTRKINQSVIIGKDADVVISVLDSREGYVRLGFEASREILIYREEILKKIQEEEKTQEEKRDATTVAS